MKKLSLLIIILSFGLLAQAQSISVKTFRALPTDMTASSLEGKRIDQNGDVAALIKVVTTQTGFTFEGGTLGIVDTKQRNGEIWVWVPRASRKITILHQQLGVLRDYRFPVDIESERTYEMVLTTAKVETVIKEEMHQQYLVFQVSPANATLEVNDKLWSVDADGTALQFVDFGTYTYRVRAANYISDAGVVTVDDPDNPQNVKVTLKPDFAEVTLKVDADAEIWVNNEKKGVRTWTGPLGKGTYKIECKQESHETSMISKEITTEMNGQIITLPAPTPIYGSLNVESTPIGATIYIDGKEVGKTPKFIPEILIGVHVVKLMKEGYEDYVESLCIVKGQRKHMVLSMKNNYDVEFICNVPNATLSIDNNIVGNASNTYKLSFGTHSIKVNSMEYVEYSETITVGSNSVKFVIEMQRILELAKFYFDAGIFSQAMVYYKQAAEQGDAQAQFEVGRMYAEGLGVPKDYSEAVKWYRKAVKQNNADAKAWLSDLYIYGYGVELNYEEALKLIRESVAQGNAYGMNNMGYMYQYGYGVEKNQKEAVQWYRKAAELGEPSGMVNLGYVYGEEKKYNEAIKWYRKAAELGNVDAMINIGYMFNHGKGVNENEREAVNWYRKAAIKGNAIGQYNLGMMYENGYGVSKDNTEALKWYRMAADQGHENAKKRIIELTN